MDKAAIFHNIMPMRTAALKAEARRTLPFLVIALVLVAFGGWRLITTLSHASQAQDFVREAQVARALVLGYQLEEETAIRGYAGTGEVFFLQPFEEAKPRMAGAFADLDNRLTLIADNSLWRSVQDERRLNTLWLKTVGEPLRSDWRLSPATLALQRHGKELVDAFLQDNANILAGLDRFAVAADSQAQQAVLGLVWFIGVTLFSLVGGTIAYVVTRAAQGNQQRIADALQLALLNRPLPVLPTVTLNAIYVPATHNTLVGGDWYDAIELPDKRILFSIGDVAGHGLVAAIAMSRARQAIIASALQEDDPARVLERANNVIMWDQSQMVTAICGFIDPHTFQIVYATAGHPPPVLARPDSPSVFLPHDGLPLGIIENTTYRSFVAKARQGAVITLYTDGVIEHGRDIIVGEERLLDATRLAVGEADPALATHRYIFNNSSHAVDDVALLTIRFAGRLASAECVSQNRSLTTTHGVQRPEQESMATANRAPDDATLQERFASVNARLEGLLEAG